MKNRLSVLLRRYKWPIGALLGAMAVFAVPRFMNEPNFPEDYIAAELAAAARGLTVDISSLREGEVRLVAFLKRPVYIYRRTAVDAAVLASGTISANSDEENSRFLASVMKEYNSTTSVVWAQLLLAAKPIALQPSRSLDTAVVVLGGWSPVSGCTLTAMSPAEGASKGYRFFDPCTRATFDTEGRIQFKGSRVGASADSSTADMSVPPYWFEGQLLRIGLPAEVPLPVLPFSKADRYGSGTSTDRLVGAARFNDLAAVREALDAGAAINISPLEGVSPLDAAIGGSSTDVVRLLLQRGASPTAVSEGLARYLGRSDVVKLLQRAR